MALDVVNGVGAAAMGAAAQSGEAAQEQDSEFLALLKKVDEYLESTRKTEAEKRREEEALRQKKAMQKRMTELWARISKLRSRVMMGDGSAEREMSALQTELLHLQMQM